MHALAAIVTALCAAAAAPLAGAASTETFRSVVMPALEDCKGRVADVTEDDINNVLHREELVTRSGKCLQLCVYEFLGGMEGGRLVSREEALAVLHRVYDGDAEKLKDGMAKIDMCGDEIASSQETDSCEMANIAQQCFRRLHK